MATKKNIYERFHEFVEKNPCIGYDNTKKRKFHALGLEYLSRLLKDGARLELKKTDIYYNPGGVAVSGDFHLRGMFDESGGFDMFFNLSGCCPWITYRPIRDMGDYSGGRNRQLPFSTIEDPDLVLDCLENMRGRAQMECR